MFKKKAEPKPSMWDDQNAIDIHYLQLKADLNESQHKQRVVTNGEYYETGNEIERYLRELENRHGFDEMMGNPMDAIEGMFHD